jgi:hypothetical protein
VVATGPENDFDPTRCRGTVRSTGRQCRKYPIAGGTVCIKHGGAAPQVRHAAKRRVVNANAAALVARSGYDPVADPVEALLDTAGEMIALKDALADQVARLQDVTVTDRTGVESVSAVLAAYERGLDRLARTLVAINRLGIMERHVSIEEAKLQMMADAVRRAVYSHTANLDYDTGQRVLEAIVVELQALPAAA